MVDAIRIAGGELVGMIKAVLVMHTGMIVEEGAAFAFNIARSIYW